MSAGSLVELSEMMTYLQLPDFVLSQPQLLHLGHHTNVLNFLLENKVFSLDSNKRTRRS